MKNLIILLLLFAVLSCRKNRVCSCTVTTSGVTQTTTSSFVLPIDTTILTPLSQTDVNNYTFKKVSKRKAKFNCFDKTEEFDETTTNNIPGLLSVAIRNKGTRDYRCKLK